MIFLEWTGTALSFLGTYLVTQHIHWGWALNLLADVLFCIFAVNKKIWGFFALCMGYLLLAAVGLLS